MVTVVKVNNYYGNQSLHIVCSHAAGQPLLHKIMWANRSCDTVSRAMKELSQHFTELLDSYHDDKVRVYTIKCVNSIYQLSAITVPEIMARQFPTIFLAILSMF